MVDFAEKATLARILSTMLAAGKWHTMSDDRHVPDIGRLVHERTDLGEVLALSSTAG